MRTFLKDFTKADNMNDSNRKPQTGEVLTDIHGRQVKIADLQTFTAVLHEQFPRGLAMPMPDEDLQHLLDTGCQPAH